MSDSTTFYRNLINMINDELYVSAPCKIISFNPTKRTIEAEPLVKDLKNNKISELVEIPLFVLGSSQFIINYPVSNGDIVLVFFCDYDISSVVVDGSLSDNQTDRLHSIQDSVAFPLYLSPYNTPITEHIDDLVIGKSDYTSKIFINPDGTINIETDSEINLTSGIDKHINLTTQGTGNVIVNAWDFITNLRKP